MSFLLSVMFLCAIGVSTFIYERWWLELEVFRSHLE